MKTEKSDFNLPSDKARAFLANIDQAQPLETEPINFNAQDLADLLLERDQLWASTVSEMAGKDMAKFLAKTLNALARMVDQGEGCVTGRDDCEPECCRYGEARAVLFEAAEIAGWTKGAA